MKTNRNKIILIGVLMVLIGAGGWYWFSNTESESRKINSNTYKQPKLINKDKKNSLITAQPNDSLKINLEEDFIYFDEKEFTILYKSKDISKEILLSELLSINLNTLTLLDNYPSVLIYEYTDLELLSDNGEIRKKAKDKKFISITPRIINNSPTKGINFIYLFSNSLGELRNRIGSSLVETFLFDTNGNIIDTEITDNPTVSWAFVDLKNEIKLGYREVSDTSGSTFIVESKNLAFNKKKTPNSDIHRFSYDSREKTLYFFGIKDRAHPIYILKLE